mgnify:CR=1 FL=1
MTALRNIVATPWKRWLSVFALAALVLVGAYYYETMSLGKVEVA